MGAIEEKHSKIKKEAKVDLSRPDTVHLYARQGIGKLRGALRVFMYENLDYELTSYSKHPPNPLKAVKVINRFLNIVMGQLCLVNAFRMERRAWFELKTFIAYNVRNNGILRLVSSHLDADIRSKDGQILYNEFVDYFTKGRNGQLSTPGVDREGNPSRLSFTLRK